MKTKHYNLLALFISIFLITNMNQLTAQVPTNGLVAYYPFNGNVEDESGNGHHGTLNGPVFVNDRFGNPNSALNFDGSNDNVDVGDILDDVFSGSDKKFSFSLWFNIDTFQFSTSIIAKSGNVNCGENERQLAINFETSQDAIAFSYTTLSGQQFRSIYTSNSIEVDELYHLVVTYDGSIDSNNGLDRVKMYLNGTLQQQFIVAEMGSMPFDIEDGDAHLGIGNALDSDGGNCNPHPFNGTMDDIRIYNRVLSPNEVTSLFNETPLGIDDRSSLNVVLYPVPTLDELNIASSLEIDELTIFSITGQEVHKIQTIDRNYSVSLQNYGSGIYFVEIRAGEATTRKKIIVK